MTARCFSIGLLAACLAGPAASQTPEERGAYLVQTIAACGNCHSPLDDQGRPIPETDLSGRFVIDMPPFKAFAKNITPASRIKDWTDEELARAIREGIRPDGSLIGPPMPFEFYRHLSDTDVTAIVAYLRSVPAVENEVPDSEYRIPLPPAYGPPVDSVADVPRGVTVEYGEYLAGPVGHCVECHSPSRPVKESELGQGGFVFDGPWGVTVSANITSHEDGLAGYSDAEIADMITKGMRPDGSRMSPPMGFPFYAKMHEDDLAAIIMYLRALPPLPDKE